MDGELLELELIDRVGLIGGLGCGVGLVRNQARISAPPEMMGDLWGVKERVEGGEDEGQERKKGEVQAMIVRVGRCGFHIGD